MDNKLFQRNLIKEKLQDAVLDFVYNSSDFNRLIFTGGTCLRKVYGLNRLSEDLDFDFLKADAFAIADFARQAGKFFKIDTKISGNKQTVFLKYPDNIFVRCDFSLVSYKPEEVRKSLIFADNRQFFVNAYTLPVLFVNKIAAFLTRNFFKGKFQKIPFKGRDVYDIFWLLQLSAKTGNTLKPDTERLKALLGDIDIKKQFIQKMNQIDAKFVYEDLYPLIEDKNFLDQFMSTFKKSMLDIGKVFV